MRSAIGLLVSVLVGFWLVGMVVLRSELSLPWLSLSIAIALSLWFMTQRTT